MKSKKGQAALEFLITYGWAFLIVMILVGALAYFGVFNPTKFLPAKCQFSPEIRCIDYRIAFDSVSNKVDYNMKLSNGLGQSQRITKIELRSPESETEVACDSVKVQTSSMMNAEPSEITPVDYVTGLTGTPDEIWNDKMVRWSPGESVTITATGCDYPSISSSGRKGKMFIVITYADNRLSAGEYKDFEHSVSGEVFAEVQKVETPSS